MLFISLPILTTTPTTRALPIQKKRSLVVIPEVQLSGKPLSLSASIGVIVLSFFVL